MEAKETEILTLDSKEYRSHFSAKPDDLIFECVCGQQRIFGRALGIGLPPENQTPLLVCHGSKHKLPLYTVHAWVPRS